MGNSQPKEDNLGSQSTSEYNYSSVTELELNKELLKLKNLLDKTVEKGGIYDKLGFIFYHKDMKEHAEYNLNKAWELGSTTSVTSYFMGTIKEAKKKYIDAIVFYKDSIDKNQKNPDPYQRIAECFLMINEVDKSLQYSQECLNLRQSDPEIHNLMGLCFFLKKNPDKALEHLESSRLLDPTNYRALNNLGNVMRKLHRLDRAIDYYKQAIKNSGGFHVAYLNLGMAYCEMGDIWNGLVNLKESMKGGTEIIQTIHRKGYNLFFMDEDVYQAIKLYYENQIDVASLFLEKAHKRNPNNVVTNFYIALIKTRMAEYLEAAKFLNFIIQFLHPYLVNKHTSTPCLKLLFEKSKEKLKQISDKLDDTINLSECIIEEKQIHDTEDLRLIQVMNLQSS
jgi:tetratricopeptide (TPR) repeat protein